MKDVMKTRLGSALLLSLALGSSGCGAADDGSGTGTGTATGTGTGTATGTGTGTATGTGTGTGTEQKSLSSIAIEPATVNVEANKTVTLAAKGTYSDGSTAALSDGVIWASSDAAIATVDGKGVVTGVKAGTATITAKLSGQTGSATITVTAATTFPVFVDDFMNGEVFLPFEGQAKWAGRVKRNTTEFHSGAASLEFDVLAEDPFWMGGAFKAAAKHDLSGYKALTFWAKASKAVSVDMVGTGNNGAGDLAGNVERRGVGVTTDWKKFTIPLLLADKMTACDGFFSFADGADGGYKLFVDDVQFEKDVALAPAAAMATEAKSLQVGQKVSLNGRGLSYDVAGDAFFIEAAPTLFTYQSSNTAVATVDASGEVTAVAAGTAEITAKYGATDVAGKLSLTVTAAPAVTSPPTAAPAVTASTQRTIDFIYTSASAAAGTQHAVDEFPGNWGQSTQVSTYTTADGGSCKKFAAFNYLGITFPGQPVVLDSNDAFHIDVWTADLTAFKVFLITEQNASHPKVEASITIDAASTPKLEQGRWVSIDLPISQFIAANPAFVPDNIQQIKFEAVPFGPGTAYVDNIYFAASP